MYYVNPVSVESAVSNGLFHEFQCMAMQTVFLAQGIITYLLVLLSATQLAALA